MSVKRQEAAAELAATEATLKVMEEMDRERNELENLEVENRQRLAIQEVENAEKLKALEQKRRELERLETIKKMNAAKAQLKVYEQGINSDEEISDLLHDNVEQRSQEVCLNFSSHHHNLLQNCDSFLLHNRPQKMPHKKIAPQHWLER